MILSDARTHYLQTQVMTSTPQQLLLLTYRILESSLSGAIEAHGRSDWAEFRRHCLKGQEVLTELALSVDRERGGELADHLLRLYGFFERQLVEANVSRRVEPVEAIRPLVGGLADAWKVAAARTAGAPAALPGAAAGGR